MVTMHRVVLRCVVAVVVISGVAMGGGGFGQFGTGWQWVWC